MAAISVLPLPAKVAAAIYKRSWGGGQRSTRSPLPLIKQSFRLALLNLNLRDPVVLMPVRLWRTARSFLKNLVLLNASSRFSSGGHEMCAGS